MSALSKQWFPLHYFICALLHSSNLTANCAGEGGAWAGCEFTPWTDRNGHWGEPSTPAPTGCFQVRSMALFLHFHPLNYYYFFFWLPSEVCKLQMVAAHSQLSSGSLCWCFSVLGDRSPQLVEVLVCEGSHCGSWLACAHRSAHRWAGNENKPCSMQSDPAVAMRRPTAAGKRMELRTRQQIQVSETERACMCWWGQRERWMRWEKLQMQESEWSRKEEAGHNK